MAQYRFVTDGDFVNFFIDAQLVSRLHNSSRYIQWSYNDTGGINFAVDGARYQLDLSVVSFNGTGISEQAQFGTKVIELFPGLAGGEGGGSIEGIESDGNNLTYNADTHQFQGNVGIGVAPTVLFQVQSGGNNFLSIDPTAGSEVVRLLATNTTDDNNAVGIIGSASNTDAVFNIVADFNDGVKAAQVLGSADASSSSISYTADTHTFNGTTVIIPPTSDPGVAGALWNNAGTTAISAG